MNAKYVLDACAMIAVLSKESGADKVVKVYQKAVSGDVSLVMSKLNLLEVYYGLFREYGKEHANMFMDEVKRSPVVIRHEISDEVFAEAGRLKALYRMSLADAVALAEAFVSGAVLLTADHHEFDVVEEKEGLSFAWIR